MRRRSPHRGSHPTPRARKRRRLGTFFFIVGILTVLGVTFAIGALAGRFSLPPGSVASGKSADPPAKPAPPPQPELTFYRELTAPLTVPPTPSKPAPRPPAKREPAPAASPPSESRELPARAVTASTSTTTRAETARYTVQVGAFTGREQAEAVRAKLAASGHAAYVFEGEAAGAPRYRVRIGVFTTAEDARQAAARLAAETRVAGFVTSDHGGQTTHRRASGATDLPTRR